MPDMLVKLYDLPEVEGRASYEGRTGVTIRRAIAPEKHVVSEWVGAHFGKGWVSECEVAFAKSPITCLIAVENGKLLGFACYDATVKGFFGPTGVDEHERGRGIGKMLLLYALDYMKQDGYGYAVIGGAGPVDFYAKTTGATVIEGSVPGVYKGMLS
ncbi:GNAT family N-acetyltransferase [Paenibacillus urinalis]|uniref:GNAT family N-acetyltransferase n=1 Tax=Paenibacillus urinalis TaxID=521520 RepID=A0AAX3N3D3_9BACL|nr:MULTISPECIES: GNAT family N-acetyltransferase [Paenibacillus]WDH83634.1 GNAT family N-acetyltransferase [Paenibacillus urinalis]WDH99662.1 GNAT family N-acetyltransferase [Paenibacillus urinalis]WDI03294.1 GNAT family N-acetyltransferase [Paenibacillus urinalis]GAK42399.1 putative N-acetyltransferase [Paenibacillus sp. TCA20]